MGGGASTFLRRVPKVSAFGTMAGGTGRHMDKENRSKGRMGAMKVAIPALPLREQTLGQSLSNHREAPDFFLWEEASGTSQLSEQRHSFSRDQELRTKFKVKCL